MDTAMIPMDMIPMIPTATILMVDTATAMIPTALTMAEKEQTAVAMVPTRDANTQEAVRVQVRRRTRCQKTAEKVQPVLCRMGNHQHYGKLRVVLGVHSPPWTVELLRQGLVNFHLPGRIPHTRRYKRRR